jgi:nitroreductase
MNNTIIDDLNWRYATKKYDAEKKISTEDFETICESLRLVPSSYGLQPVKYIVINNKSMREKLLPLAYNQPQITDASHLIVICSYRNISPKMVGEYLSLMSETRNIPLEDLSKFGENMDASFAKLSTEELCEWTAKQGYISLGHIMHTCANLRIDATPMEGFNKTSFDEALNLASKNLQSVLLLAVGYRSSEDNLAGLVKVRKSTENLFETI